MIGEQYFYRRIADSNLRKNIEKDDYLTIKPAAFKPRPRDLERGGGPSVTSALYKTAREALDSHCVPDRKPRMHLVIFPGSAVEGDVELWQDPEDPSHFELRGQITDEYDDAWAYKIANEARLCLHCYENEPYSVPAEVPEGCCK